MYYIYIILISTLIYYKYKQMGKSPLWVPNNPTPDGSNQCGPINNKTLFQMWTLGLHLREAAERGSGDPLSSPNCYQLVTGVNHFPSFTGRGERIK